MTVCLDKAGKLASAYRLLPVLFAAALLAACAELKKPEPKPYFAETAPPPVQEFRWSNGRTARSFDPARAAAPPETDIARAIYEGLTETDPRTLEAVPAAAEKWESEEGGRIWTFHLRREARWSNGKPVTAHDFERSWRRLARLGDAAAHRQLTINIAGLDQGSEPRGADTEGAVSEPEAVDANTAANSSIAARPPSSPSATAPTPRETFAAIGEHTFRVVLRHPDPDLPRLVSNPVFRPVYGSGDELVPGVPAAPIATNGAFDVISVDADCVVLERSDTYWNRRSVKLERVRFVPMPSAERALEAYRAGELDAVTNAEFAPAALKLLTPYDDFLRTTHGALNFYEVNAARPPFSDRRVRVALSAAIDRERLTAGEMEGLTRPAYSFLPFGPSRTMNRVAEDTDLARGLLEEAGYPGGENFPVTRLVVNRNDTQIRVARTVAEMWKQELNIQTEVVIKEPAEIEEVRRSGEYDLIRRGVVMPTADEAAGIMAIFDMDEIPKPDPVSQPAPERLRADAASSPSPTPEEAAGTRFTEETAIHELRAIPLYFPTSYSLVKPYVNGFEINSIDALSLLYVEIDNSWKPGQQPPAAAK